MSKKSKKQDAAVVPGPRLLPEPEVLRVGKGSRERTCEAITFRYPRTTDRIPWPVGMEVPRVSSYVAETVDEAFVSVEMVYKPVRQPSRVKLTIQEVSPSGGLDPHKKTIEVLPFSPAAARDLGKLLIETADLAEEMDTKPYPPPEDAAPPVR